MAVPEISSGKIFTKTKYLRSIQNLETITMGESCKVKPAEMVIYREILTAPNRERNDFRHLAFGVGSSNCHKGNTSW